MAFLILVAVILTGVLIGGTRLVFSLPGYAILGVAGIASLSLMHRPAVASSRAALLATGFLFGYVILRIFFSPVEYLARVDLLMVGGALAVYLLVTGFVTNPQQRIAIIGVLLVFALVHTGIGLVQVIGGDNFMLLSFMQRVNYGARASGFYICPNHLAGYLEVVAMLGLGIAFWSNQKIWIKLLVGYCALVSLFGVGLTGSRGGYVSTLTGLAVLVLVSLFIVKKSLKHYFWRLSFGICAVAVVGVGGIAFLIAKNDYLLTRMQGIYDPTNMRLELWKGALQQFTLSPIFGTGSATYFYYGRMFRPSWIYNDPIYTHNDYLQFLAEFGLVGAVLFLAFFLCHLFHGWRATHWFATERASRLGRVKSDALALNIGALAALATYVVHSILDFNLHIPVNAMLLALVFALLANPGVTDIFKTSRQIQTIANLSLPVLGLGLLAFTALYLPGEYFAERSRVAIRDGRYWDGAYYAGKGIYLESTNPYLHRYVGEAYASVADEFLAQGYVKENQVFYKKALAGFKNAVALVPYDFWLLLHMGWAYDALEERKQAEWYFREAIKWNPNSAQVHAFYGFHLLKWREFERAKEVFEHSNKLLSNKAAQNGLELLEKQKNTRNTGES